MNPDYPYSLPPYLSWGIIGLVLLVAIIVITFSFKSLNATLTNWPTLSARSVTEPKTPTPSSSSSSSSSSSTNNWVNYTNNTYGFSLKYPNGWQNNEKATNGQTTIIISTKDTVSSNPAYTILINQDALDATVSANISKYMAAKNYQLKTITFAGENATQITFLNPDGSGQEWGMKVIIFAHNKSTYVVSGITSDPVKVNNNDLGVFDAISSTWQFK